MYVLVQLLGIRKANQDLHCFIHPETTGPGSQLRNVLGSVCRQEKNQGVLSALLVMAFGPFREFK